MTYEETAALLPEFFEPMLVEQYGEETARAIVEGCGVRRCVTLRANALLSDKAEIAAVLDEAGIPWHDVPWYGDAFVIEDLREKSLWDLPAYDQGKVYLQSLSSMLPPLVLGAESGVDILDMCAAPGGKTTQLAAMGGKGTHITACEMHVPRAEKLEYNLQKQGAGNVVVMRTDARQLDEFFRFDRVLLDAPCSGSGTLRACDPKLGKFFTEALVQKSVKSQKALLAKALSVLKPGGTLVYSTCSVLQEENEDVVRWALDWAAKGGKPQQQPKKKSRKGRSASTIAQPTLDSGAEFEIEPIVLGNADGSNEPNDPRNHWTFLPHADELPVLPTTLDGTLCVCPTDKYEGFFVAKIRRMK